MLLVRVRRYKCCGCGRSWRKDLTAAAVQRARLSCRGMRWALEALVIDHLTASRIAAGLGVSWHTANDAVLAEGKRVLIDDPGRFDGVKVIGVDEHVWRHTRGSGRFVTVIIDLTPVRDKTGPSRLLDMVPGALQERVQDLARRPAARLARGGRGRRDGRLHRVQDRRQPGAARRGDGDGPVPRRQAVRRRARPVPSPDPTRHAGATGPQERPPSTKPAPPCTPARAYSPNDSRYAWKRCSPMSAMPRSRPPGESASGW